MDKPTDINTLVRRVLTGEATPLERNILAAMLREDEILRKQYVNLLDERDFAKRYDVYRRVNLAKAKAEAGKLVRRGRIRRIALRVLAGAAAAAAVAVLVVVNTGRRKPEPPVVSKDMYAAICKAEANGHTEAVIAINGVKAGLVGNAQGIDSVVSTVAQEANEGKEELQAHVETLHNKEFWITLEDGTIVHLNYNSSLTYPVCFDGERRVRLRGEAYFIVAHDERHPFIVETPHGVATDYGTEFDIVARPSGTEVTLVKGKVGVATHGGGERMLAPGHKAMMNAGGTLVMEKADLAPIKAWNTGNYHFDGATLRQLMEVVARWHGKNVRFENREAQDALFTGDLDKYASPEPTFHAISAITGCKIVVEDDAIVVK